mgnify:FL=1
MYDVIVILSTALLGLVFSYLVVTFFNVESNANEGLVRDVQQMGLQMATLSVSVVFGPINGVWGIGSDLGTMATSRWKWLVAGILFIGVTFLQHYYHSDILSVLDDSWTCAVKPILENVVEPFLNIFRVLYALGAPIGNAFLVVHGQFFRGWVAVLAKCGHVRLFDFFLELSKAAISFMAATAKWFGAGGALGEHNNFIVNDYNITKPVNHAMKSVVVLQEALSCACYRFRPIFKTAFYIFTSDHLAPFVSNVFETGVRALQLVFRILYREFPDIYRVTFKLERAILELGLLSDELLFHTLENFVQLILQVDDLDKKDQFQLSRYPAEALFTSMSHVGVAITHAVATLTINGPLTLMASFLPTKSAFTPETWSLEKSVSHLHLAIYDVSALVQWLIYVVEHLVMNSKNIEQVFRSPTTPVHLSCDWARDVEKVVDVDLGYTVGCSMYNLGIMTVNLWYIAYGASIELATRSIFTHQQNVFRTLQRWEGSSISRNKVFTCEERRDMLAYDYTDPNPVTAYNDSGVIWTQNRGLCQCNMYYNTTRPEHARPYDPFCGQANLNFDVFAPADALVMHVFHGVFGPGFGDAAAYVPKLNKIDIKILSVSKSIPLPIVLPPISRTVIESARVLLRVVFSFGDIVTGNYFNYPVNCGHGMNKTQLLAQWKATHPNEPATTDEIMRWTPCKNRQYTSTLERLPLCASGEGTSGNDKSNCMCSYTEPLTAKSQCRCIARYPDLDVTSASGMVGDLIEERFTSESVSQHWCNSMTLEWTFQNAAAFTSALDYIVSLGPVNPKCNLVDELFDGKPMTFNETEQRQRGTYLIATTPTLQFMSEFVDTKTKLNHLSELYGETQSDCTIQPGKWVTTTDAYNHSQTEWQDAEWSCDSTDFVSLAGLDPRNPTTTSDSLKTPGCRIWARDDFFCSAGLFVRSSARLGQNSARQLVNDAIAVLAGNFEDVTLNVMPRVCDYERIWGSLAGMVAGIIPNIGETMKLILARYLTIIFETAFVLLVRNGVTLFNTAFHIIKTLVDTSASKASMEKVFKTGVNNLVNNYLWVVKFFFTTTGQFLDEIATDAGKICFSIVKILDVVEKSLKEGLMDIVATFGEMVFQVFAIFTGDTSQIDGFFDNFFYFWVELTEILLQEVWQILDKIYDFFGGIGDFFRVLTWTVCEAINAVMEAINTSIQVLCFDLCDGIGWKNMKCYKKPLGASRGAHGPGRLAHHMLQSHDNRNITRAVAEKLDWSGTSKCDHFMEAAAAYTYSELRPLEKAQWFECLELKLIGVEMAKVLQAPHFPTDIMYNWKRKYTLAYDVVRVFHTVAHDLVQRGQVDWNSIRMSLNDKGLDADMYMNLFQKASRAVISGVKAIEMDPIARHLARHADKQYDNPANPSMTAHLWRAFQSSQSVYRDTTRIWTQEDMSRQMWTAVDASHDVHSHLHQWWTTLDATVHGDWSTGRVISHLQNTFRHHWSEKDVGLGQTHAREEMPTEWLGMPLRTSILKCVNRTEYVSSCVDCAIVDNLIETIIQQTNGVVGFYGDSFPKIIDNVSYYFTNELPNYDSDFFGAQFSKLTSSRSAVPPLHATYLRWRYHVLNDWVYFVTNITEFTLDWNNATRQQRADQQVRHLINATRLFVTGINESYVPFYGYSFNYMYNEMLFGSCDLDATLFVTTTTQDQRLSRMDMALLICTVLSAVLVTNAYWSVFPLMWLVNTIVISLIVVYVYLYVVYGYMIACVPIMPYTLFEDVYAWYEMRINPGCFYHLLPYLASGASEDTCTHCSTPPVYKDCNTYTVVNQTGDMLGLNELVDNYNIFWPSLFWVRWQLPDVATWFVRNAILDLHSPVGKLALGAWQNEAIDPVWIDCFYAMWLDNILAGMAVTLATYISFRITIITVQTLIRAVLLACYSYQTLGLISETVEDYTI